jgi:hypothetical protein
MNKILRTLIPSLLLAAGCAHQAQWQIKQVQWNFGTNWERTFTVPLLLDTKTGRTWGLHQATDGGATWTPLTIQTNNQHQKVLP